MLREGVKKNLTVADNVNVGGGGLTSFLQLISWVFLKRKGCRMFWNGKICILMKIDANLNHKREGHLLRDCWKIIFFFFKSYVLDHSGSFDMHIGKLLKRRFFCVRCFSYGRGGVKKLRTCLQLLGFFYAFPQRKYTLLFLTFNANHKFMTQWCKN